MTADDVFSMPRDLLVALVVAQDERINALVADGTTHSALLATKDERIAALEGEKAELQITLQQTRQALFGPSSERTARACQTTIRMAYRRQLGWRIFAFSRNRL